MTAREVIAALTRDGWVRVATVGDHRQFRHPVKRGRVTVSGKLGGGGAARDARQHPAPIRAPLALRGPLFPYRHRAAGGSSRTAGLDRITDRIAAGLVWSRMDDPGRLDHSAVISEWTPVYCPGLFDTVSRTVDVRKLA